MACNSPELRFDIIDTYDSRVLRIADLSEWEHLEEQPTYIDFTTPGKTNPVTLYFIKNKVNYYNSNLLQVTCSDCVEGLGTLPDGIYTVRLYVCEGTKFCKQAYYLRTVKTELRLDKVLMNLHFECGMPSDKLLKEYQSIKLLLDAAHAHTRDGNIESAACTYEKALGLLEDFESCTNNEYEEVVKGCESACT